MSQSFPLPITDAMVTPAYVPVIAYIGGETGDDVSEASANATGDYSPRTQAAKAVILGVDLAVDITTPRGWIDPLEPYEAQPEEPPVEP